MKQLSEMNGEMEMIKKAKVEIASPPDFVGMVSQ